MENTIENKLALIALYWGQEVLSLGSNDNYEVNFNWMKIAFEVTEPNYSRLKLRQLSSVTDDEAIEILTFMGFTGYAEVQDAGTMAKAVILALFVIASNDMMKHELIIKQMLFDFSDISSVVDKIRSMGFAYKWKNLSVEDQVSNGWIEIIKK